MHLGPTSFTFAACFSTLALCLPDHRLPAIDLHRLVSTNAIGSAVRSWLDFRCGGQTSSDPILWRYLYFNDQMMSSAWIYAASCDCSMSGLFSSYCYWPARRNLHPNFEGRLYHFLFLRLLLCAWYLPFRPCCGELSERSFVFESCDHPIMAFWH